LQRVLDVTNQRERIQRMELLALSRRIARLRQEVTMHRVRMRSLVAEMAAAEFAERLRRHLDFILLSEAHQREIDRLEAQLRVLSARRAEKTQRLIRTRKRRETLERLREEARQAHVREELKIEQRQFDETAHLAKAREMIAARAGGAE
jgi:flagellar biosynthesis chaperone FliJ